MASSVPRIKIKLKLTSDTGNAETSSDSPRVDTQVSDGSSDDDAEVALDKIPKRYRDIVHLLSQEEKKLLQKYSMAKKVTLKVAPSMQRASRDPTDRTALAKVALEQQQRRGGYTASLEPTSNAPRYSRPAAGSRGESEVEGVQKEVEQGEILERRPKMKRPRIIASNQRHPESSLYDRRGFLLNGDWNSQNQSEALLVGLPNLSFSDLGNPGKSGNTLIVWATMPIESKRFCFNICPSSSYKEADPKTEIWYHFNPRDGWGRKHVIQNSYRNGSWDKGADKSIAGLPFAKGKKFEFRLHFSEAGFCLYVDNELQTEYFHRFGNGIIQANQSVYLIIPTIEERYGDRENVIVHAIWWGHNDSDPARLLRQQKSNDSKPRPKKRSKTKSSQAKATYQYEEKVLYVAGLPRDSTAKDELLRLFAHYGMTKDSNGEYMVKTVDNQGYGFVTLESAKNVEDAIQYLDGQPGRSEGSLKVTRARKSLKPR